MEESMMHAKNIIISMGWFILICIWTVLAYGGYLLWFPITGLEVKTFAIDSLPKVQAGQLTTYTISYCVDGQLPVTIVANREIVSLSPQVHAPIVPPISFSIQERCSTRRMFLTIPDQLPPGLYRLIWLTEVEVNPLRTVTQKFESKPFEVIK
jgi:hypothetical protein